MVADSEGQTEASAPGGSYAVGVLCATGQPANQLLRCLEAEGVRVVPMDWNDPSLGTASVDVLLLDLTEADRGTAEEFAGRAGVTPLAIAAISWGHLRAPGLTVATADVLVTPWRQGELSLRIKRLVQRRERPDQPGVIRAGDLVINPERYDVFLARKPVLLTFKEYELLKLLAANPGRVYSREALLEQVWGYKYFGGTRTVDVHVRRLRSKIEDATHTFIDTVWNVGYRFHG